jgi:hypothetical protein
MEEYELQGGIMNCIKVISIQLTTSKENPTKKWVPKVGCNMKDGYELKVQRKSYIQVSFN